MVSFLFLLFFTYSEIELPFVWLFPIRILPFMSFLFVPLLVLLLSISHHCVVLFDNTFINPLYAMCTPIFQGFIIHVPMNGHSLDNDWIKISAGLWGFVAIEVWACNANALGYMHISYYKINTSKNLPAVKQHCINLHSLP